ncbi:hypothetical protein Tco_1390881 [Tanacetum coccineum]
MSPGKHPSPVLLFLVVDGEKAYQSFQWFIENSNVVMATYEDPLLGVVMVYPEKGFRESDTESFQSGLGSKSKPCTKFFRLSAKDDGLLLRDNFEGGATWAIVEGQL